MAKLPIRVRDVCCLNYIARATKRMSHLTACHAHHHTMCTCNLPCSADDNVPSGLGIVGGPVVASGTHLASYEVLTKIGDFSGTFTLASRFTFAVAFFSQGVRGCPTRTGPESTGDDRKSSVRGE